jgi:hypothetical protein
VIIACWNFPLLTGLEKTLDIQQVDTETSGGFQIGRQIEDVAIPPLPIQLPIPLVLPLSPSIRLF